jgi:hypothetical protein
MRTPHRKKRSIRLPDTGLFESRIGEYYQPLPLTKEALTMFYAFSWFVVLGLLAVWSLGAWMFHAVAVWAVSNAVSNAGSLSGAATGIEGLRLPDWLGPWVPPEMVQLATSLFSGLAPAVEGLFQAVPAIAGGLSVATWVIWGLGSVVLMLVGTGLHLLIAIGRRRSGGVSGAQPHPPAAA